MADLKQQLLRIASDLPKGDPTRRSLLAALSPFHAPPDEQLQYVMDELRKAGEKGVRATELPHEGRILALTKRLAEADRGRLYITPAGRQQKVAHAGREILSRIVDERAFLKLYNEVEKQDEQSAKLLREVRAKLAEALKITDNEYNALGRVQQLVAAQGRWDIGLQRNNIFKAADLLGMKLPSAMF